MTIIKICGIKTLKDALAAIDAGADYLGFNFYPKGVRFIEKEVCAEITAVLKKEHPNIKLVGVFVNSSVDDVKSILQFCSLDLDQLHGDETPEIFAQLTPRAFRAFRGIPSDITGYERNDVPALLVDAAVKGMYGGSVIRCYWQAD
jgi:phosphoribosylanthranilate isomerase